MAPPEPTPPEPTPAGETESRCVGGGQVAFVSYLGKKFTPADIEKAEGIRRKFNMPPLNSYSIEFLDWMADGCKLTTPETIFYIRDLDFARGLAREHVFAGAVDVEDVARLMLPVLREARRLFEAGVDDIPGAIHTLEASSLDDVHIVMNLHQLRHEPEWNVAWDMVRLAVFRWRSALSN